MLPERAWFLQNDGAKPEAAHALAESVESFGMLDGLWLNAGPLAFSTVENTTETQFDTIMANNVRSQYVVDGGLLRLYGLRHYLCVRDVVSEGEPCFDSALNRA